ncbi:cytochrome P450 709B1-like [Mercurialis annua]|uniref:cytochrome P450 709B1-like n=1 Tax=Mercurialis annua TaxID=3986 RepID=UPI0024AD1E3E|nr:cytochrome P450 709B1-like [Mercurialis annua]
MEYLGTLMLGFVVTVVITKIWQLFRVLLWRPYVLTKLFESQGVKGPSYKLLYGSLNEIKKLKKIARETVLDVNSNDDITCRVLPQNHKWSSEYGDTVLFWNGTEPRIIVTEPELAKQILSNKFGFYVKPYIKPVLQKLAGKGLILVEGRDWVRHRRILNPAFSMNKLKIMIKKMADCTISMLEEWQTRAVLQETENCKIEMSESFQELTGDIIAHTAFGSSYLQGKEVFKGQKEFQKLLAVALTDINIPGIQYFPTESNLRIWKLDRKVKNTLSNIIQNRLKAEPCSDGCYGDDLLGLMIGSAIHKSNDEKSQSSAELSMDEIMEECKTFFFAGQETTSSLLTWTIFLLSKHQDWQEKLRQEVLNECEMQVPDADMLAKLKFVNMVLLEALRLYSPIIALSRKVTENIKLGNLTIPKDTCLTIPLVQIQRSKKHWGEDANEFNPMRFANGISKAAKHPNAFLAFSMGPRACIGQNFAILEAKTVLVLILQRFSFCLSFEYKHAPIDHITLHPQYGMPIVVKPLHF